MDRQRPSAQKVPVVCFGCRVATKVAPAQLSKIVPCPRCLCEMRFVGRYFKVPPRRALAQWRKAELLWSAGWRAGEYWALRGRARTPREAREQIARLQTKG